MEIICIDTPAFHKLVRTVVDKLKEENHVQQDRWLKIDEAMDLLGVKSRTTMQKLRDEGGIRFTKVGERTILYDRQSIEQYLENQARDTF